MLNCVVYCVVVTVDPLPAEGVTVTVEAEAGLGQVEPEALTVTVEGAAVVPSVT